MRLLSDTLNFQRIVTVDESGLHEEIARFVYGDGSIEILGTPFADAASARIDIAIKDLDKFKDALPEVAYHNAIDALTPHIAFEVMG